MDERLYARIDDVPEAEWARATPDDFFFRLDFLRVLAGSGVEDARYRLLVLTDEGKAVGAAVLSAFTLRLDLLSGDPWIARLRRLFPSLLDIPMVCCGVPASFGQHHFHVHRREHVGEAFRRVDRALNAWADEEGAGLFVWKEWGGGGRLPEVAREHGYLVLPTLPDYVIDPLPPTVDDFVGAMRSSYRRKFRTALALLDGPGPVWRDPPLRLEERPFGPGDAAAFHRGYTAVMERTPVRLETYPPEFFEGLARSDVPVRALHLCNEHERTRLSALLVPAGGTLTFALVAKERARHDDGLYTTLLRCIALLAVRGGFRTLRLGQTSDYSKSSVGARPRRLETFLRLEGPVKHAALRLLGPSLFPETTPPELRVFRDGSAPGPPSGPDAPSTVST